MTLIETERVITDKIGIEKIKFFPDDTEGAASYQFTFYRNNLQYIEWLDIESGEILLELLNIDKSVIEK